MAGPSSAEVVICGAGIAGVSVAFHLAVERGMRGVRLIDPRPPLTLTSDKSTECYRNWWPNAPMVGLMNRSIDLLEEYARRSENSFGLNRRGYLYVTAGEERLAEMKAAAEATTRLGAGELRLHGDHDRGYVPPAPHGFEDQPEGADLFLSGGLLRKHFPYLSPKVVGGLHARRAGWLSAQQLGAWMLEQALGAGASLSVATVVEVEVEGGRVSAVCLDDGSRIDAPVFVNAAGPMLAPIARLVGVELPVHSEVHQKVAFRDVQGVIPRQAPFLIWNDRQRLPWSEEEKQALVEEGREDLVEEMPVACHGRPEGGEGSDWVLALWEYRREVREPTWPLPDDPLYPEVVLRGMTTMVPGLAPYLERMPQPVVDGGYYTKTAENRPLAGPMGPNGAFVAGALSGFGVMAACAVGELVSQHITGEPLPDYARWFTLDRYEDPAYLKEIEEITDTGQL